MSVVFADTTRSIGLVLAVVIFLGSLAAIFFNVKRGKAEIGSEVELAANRKPYLPDEELEGRKLDIALTLGLVLLTVCSVTLPVYFVAEAARQDNKVASAQQKLVNEGEELYGELCALCHGSIDQGGVANFTLQTDSGQFIQTVEWKAPALNTAGWRFSEEDLTDILNFGRRFSPMPAWGAPGGGPNTEQQIEALIAYINSEEVKPTIAEMREQVDNQLANEMAALTDENGDYVAVVDGEPRLNNNRECVEELEADDPDASAEEVSTACAVPLADGGGVSFYASEGEALYNLGVESGFAGAGYSCARCHTPGAAYGADDQLRHFPIPDPNSPLFDDPEIKAIVSTEPLGICVELDRDDTTSNERCFDAEDETVGAKRLGGERLNAPPPAGSGALGKSLIGIEDRCTRAQHITLINLGSETGVRYCTQGQGSGGQMPAFAQMLSAEHIEAIVDYERGLAEEAVAEEVQAG